MEAQRLHIEAKTRTNPAFPLVSLADFRYRDGGSVDPRIVVEHPTVTLYCLDHANHRAIFVETPPDLDLSHAPFLYQTQYDAAQSLIALPYATLRQLATAIPFDAQQLILLYSTGRCGSTLVSRAFNQAAGVYSLSEPDVFTQLVSLREPDGSNDSDVRDLVRDCTTIMCARTPGRTTWVLKFRSFGIELGDLFYHLFPESKVVFLYRNAEGYIRSLARAVRLFEPETQPALPAIQQVFSRLAPVLRAYTATHPTTIPPIELPVVLWVSVMQQCIALQQHGVPMVCARYEELKHAPRAMLAAIFAYCDVSVPDPTALDTVLAQDSQAGTTFSQVQAEQASSGLTDAQVRDVHRLLQHYAPRFIGDVMLPHTFVPGRS